MKNTSPRRPPRARPEKTPGPAQTATHEEGPGRPRSDACHEAILRATHELLEEVGFAKLSIEGVAARAKVGKTTIYRWWSSKGALAMDAFLAAVSPALSFPTTASARADIEAQVRKLARVYRGRTGHIIREMLGFGLLDPDTMKLFYEGYLAPRRAAGKEVLQRGIDAGEFRTGFDLESMVDALYAPIFHRLLIGHGPIDDAFVTQLLDMVLDGIAVPRPDRDRGQPTAAPA